MMIDIDYFKNYNDRYGHLVGDAILREVANTIKESVRQIDLVGRYGGEEFSIILTETAAEQSKFVAERIRKAVEDKHIKVYDEDLKATISIGVATFPEDAREPQAIIERADKALYRAKEAGRNRACLYSQK
jgi:diguanylate cyclase (GGDEF)-like protein